MDDETKAGMLLGVGIAAAVWVLAYVLSIL